MASFFSENIMHRNRQFLFNDWSLSKLRKSKDMQGRRKSKKLTDKADLIKRPVIAYFIIISLKIFDRKIENHYFFSIDIESIRT